MQVTPKSRRIVRAQNLIFICLLLAVVGSLAWLSTRYSIQSDWTAGGRRTLSPASVQMLGKIVGPVAVKAFVSDRVEARKHISELMNRYQRHKPDLSLEFVDPLKEPGQVREYEVTNDGELVIEYKGRRERLQAYDQNEQSITNALQRLARSGEQWLVFLDGHGERKPQGQANHDLEGWAKQLESKGFKIRPLNLGSTAQVPDNTTVLVIAGPQVDLLPGEVAAILGYVKQGGNVLWLNDPGPLRGLAPLAEQLGVSFQAGMIVDLTTQVLGIDNPAIAVVTNYLPHPITQDFALLTVFPLATAVDLKPPPEWEGKAFLQTSNRSWLEKGKLTGEVKYDAGVDKQGPLELGVALTRSAGEGDAGKEQRVVVLGDGDFLSNAYLGNVGNLDLGMNIINWLSQDEAFISIPAKTAPDSTLSLSMKQFWSLSVVFLLGVPLVLVGVGIMVWLRRRKR